MRVGLCRMMMCWGLLTAILLLATNPALSQRQLVVGRDGTPWTQAQDSSAFVNVADDSIWIWRVEAGENLGPGALRRGGAVFASGLRPMEVAPSQFVEERTILNTRAAQAMLDGDPDTAFNPDEAGLERQVEVYVDLGGVFGIERVRFFPRLDSGHVGLFSQTFDLGLGQRLEPLDFARGILDQEFNFLLRFAGTQPNDRAVVEWPGIKQVTGTRQARFVRFQPLSGVAWEIAELEVYASGLAPSAEFVSAPLLASSGQPVWGRVRHEGGRSLEELPVVLQTRTGPDEEPVHYYVRIGERLRRESRAVWEVIEGIEGAAEKGPVLPNPEWSAWETVKQGLIRSPGPNRYLQFRVRLLEPGAKLERLVFEYSTPPLAGRLEAELSPAVVDPGAETAFVLTLQTRRLEEGGDTGFRVVEVLTRAEIEAIDSVRVDDQEVVYTVRQEPERGFAINLWRRVHKDGSLVQVFFRGKVFVDGTPFQVRALEERAFAGEETDTVYQFAREGDVEPVSLGATLAVRLSSAQAPLIGDVEAVHRTFTPNGDGVNDAFRVGYSLLKLTRPAPVFFEVFDLAGERVRQGYAGADESGRFARVWDGKDETGERVPPGMYLYRIQVEADAGTASRQGVVGVVY